MGLSSPSGRSLRTVSSILLALIGFIFALPMAWVVLSNDAKTTHAIGSAKMNPIKARRMLETVRSDRPEGEDKPISVHLRLQHANVNNRKYPADKQQDGGDRGAVAELGKLERLLVGKDGKRHALVARSTHSHDVDEREYRKRPKRG